MANVRRIVAFFLLLVNIFTPSKTTIVNVNEGESVELYFPYPCNNSEITLQHGNGSPFYSSQTPDADPQSGNRKIINPKASENCILNLEIDPVQRTDEGTFILVIYKTGKKTPDLHRIGLRVAYHPGKASCILSNDFDDGEWVSLQCSALEGTKPGQILCYQEGRRQPQLTEAEWRRTSSSQVILVRSVGLVYCCSSLVEVYKDYCECKDFVWDPVEKISLRNAPDPCPTPSVTATDNNMQQSTEKAYLDDEKSTILSNSKTIVTTMKSVSSTLDIDRSFSLSDIIIIVSILISTCIVLFVVVMQDTKKCKVGKKKSIQSKQDNVISPIPSSLKNEKSITFDINGSKSFETPQRKLESKACIPNTV